MNCREGSKLVDSSSIPTSHFEGSPISTYICSFDHMIIRTQLILLLLLMMQVASAQLGIKEETPSLTVDQMADTSTIDIYLETADRLMFQKPSEAYIYSQKALAIAKRINDSYGIYMAYMSMGAADFQKSKYVEALALYKLALDIATQEEDKDMIVTAYNDMAIVYTEQGKIIKALQLYKKALDMVEMENCECGAGAIYNNVASIYSDIDSVDKSKIYFEKALEIFKKEADEIGVGAAYSNLGDYYMKKKQFAEAESFFYKVLEIYRKNADPETGFYAYINLGNINGETKNFISAHTFLDSAAMINSSSNSRYYNAMLAIDRGKLFLHQNDKKEARQYLEEALNISKSLNANFLIKESASLLYKLQADSDDYKSAFENLQLIKTISDSTSSINNSANMAHLQEAFALEQEKQAKYLAAEKLIASKNRNLFHWTLAVLGAALIIGFLSFHLYRQKVKIREAGMERDKLSIDLEGKNKEITSKVMYLARKNELIKSISSKLAGNQRNLSTSNRKVVQEIIHELKTGQDDDVWREFEIRFMEVHQSFYKKMKTDFPSLSQNDMRLCAFLKLNLSTKDIAGITFQSIGSIEVARARLRKKLGISNTNANLTEFIHAM